MNTKLYVGNLSFNTTENDLQDAFAAHGPVTSVDLIMDKASGRPRGFAFVTMETKEGAEAAIAALNGKNVDGRDLTVNEARPREERSGGFGANKPRREFNSRY
jgi:cold-inducible RNA-binding protein